MLQVITGRKPTDPQVAERGLGRWAGMQSVEDAVDPRMDVREEEWSSIRGAVKLGIVCTAKVAVDRPTMNEVYHLLNNLDDFASGMAMSTRY